MSGNSGSQGHASGFDALQDQRDETAMTQTRTEPPDMPDTSQCTACRQRNHDDCTDGGKAPNHCQCGCH